MAITQNENKDEPPKRAGGSVFNRSPMTFWVILVLAHYDVEMRKEGGKVQKFSCQVGREGISHSRTTGWSVVSEHLKMMMKASENFMLFEFRLTTALLGQSHHV